MTEQLHKWQKDFVLKEDLTQGDFEALEMALSKMPMALLLRKTDSALSHGAMLRAAIRAGWIESPECKTLTDDTNGEAAYFYNGKDVDEMHPAVVSWLGAKVDAKYNAILGAIPKNL